MSSRQVCRTGHSRAGIAAILLAAAGVLAGCGTSEPEETSSSGGTAAPPKPVASNAQNDMVAAVSYGTEQGLVDLRFALLARPKVGQPVDIELALTPTVELERMFARFQAAEGLQLVSGGETQQIENPAKGVSVGHKVTVLPQADGIFYITAVVLADSEKESIARTFTIPLIAGEGLPALPTPAATPPSASVANQPQSVPKTP
jgi:hypothetical protein